MMKHAMVAIFATSMIVGVAMPASAGPYDDIYLQVGDSKDRYRVGDLKTVSVCELKARLAKELKLDARKFELFRNGGFLLDEDRTLYGAGVTSASTVTVKMVSGTFQCT